MLTKIEELYVSNDTELNISISSGPGSTAKSFTQDWCTLGNYVGIALSQGGTNPP